MPSEYIHKVIRHLQRFARGLPRTGSYYNPAYYYSLQSQHYRSDLANVVKPLFEKGVSAKKAAKIWHDHNVENNRYAT